VRAVLDVNVLIAAILSREGAPARLMAVWRQGRFELVVSAALLDELERVLAYPKIRRRLQEEDAAAFVALLRREPRAADPAAPPVIRASDPGDDYLIALAASAGALLVSGDAHLLDLVGRIPVSSPAAFLSELEQRDR
jgi:putative PIN family toxin of toxin-antitoxin system